MQSQWKKEDGPLVGVSLPMQPDITRQKRAILQDMSNHSRALFWMGMMIMPKAAGPQTSLVLPARMQCRQEHKLVELLVLPRKVRRQKLQST